MLIQPPVRRWFVCCAPALLALTSAMAARAGDPPAAASQPAASAPAAPLAAGGPLKPLVVLETSLGNVVLELDGEKAPVCTENFIAYAEAGYYNGTIFHRVMKDFMIQGGGFLPTLEEKTQGLRPPIKNEWKNGLTNAHGTIAMARTSEPDSATAQFFINVVDNTKGTKSDLDTPRGGAAYAVFGKVVLGLDVVEKIRNTPVKDDPKLPMGTVVPVEPVLIKSVKVQGKYDRAKIAAMSAAVGKPAPPARWKAKLNELRPMFAAAQKAQADAASAPADKREAAQKEAAQLMQVAKEGEADLMKIAAEDAEQEIQKYIPVVEKETGKKFEKTASGLRWTVLTPGAGTGALPKPADKVTVHYTGWLLDGTKFDSSVDRGQPAEFALNGVIKGWTEGVGMMKVGEKRKLIIPPDMAYGFRPQGGIPMNAVLVFDVELIGIAGQ